MIEKININGVEYAVTPVTEGEAANGVTVKVDGVTYLLGEPIVAPAVAPAASSGSQAIEKVQVNGVVYDIADVEGVEAEIQRATEAEETLRTEIETNTTDLTEMKKDIANQLFAASTADKVSITGRNQQSMRINFSAEIPAATTEKAGVMSAKDKEKLDTLVINDLTTGGADKALSAEMGKTIANAINNIKPVVINGSVTNAADEEDITSDNNLLKLKDRLPLNGMGYVILRSGKSFAEQITQENTIYEIRYDFDLNGEEVTIPENCTLKFEGGSLCNGTLKLNYTGLYGEKGCFNRINISTSNIDNHENVFINSDGDDRYFIGDDSDIIRTLFSSFSKVIIHKDYEINNVSIKLNHSLLVEGENHTITIHKTKETETETSYVFISFINPAHTSYTKNTIELKSINIISRNSLFGTSIPNSSFGYRGVVLQSLGHNVVLRGVNINTNGTIVTNWGYNEKTPVGDLYVENSTLKAAMYIEEDIFNKSTYVSSTLSIDTEDSYFYQCYLISNTHNIDIINCKVHGGIEVGGRTEHLGIAVINITNSELDDSFSVYGAKKYCANVTINNCSVYRQVSNTNINLNSKVKFWSGCNISILNTRIEISAGFKYSPLMLITGGCHEISIKNCYFYNANLYDNECEKILHIQDYENTYPDKVIFSSNIIECDSYKVIILSTEEYQPLKYDKCLDNIINTSVPIYARFNSLENYPLVYQMFPKLRTSGPTSKRPVLDVANTGRFYMDSTLNKPIWWTGTAWVDSTGTEV